jgi:hypothetical protein
VTEPLGTQGHRVTGKGPWPGAAGLAAVTLLYALLFSPFYFSQEYLPRHDFNVAFPSGHIVANHLLNGTLPLWSPEQNGGSPLWPDTEVFPGWDPVSLAVHLVAGWAGRSSVYAHVMVMFFWHVAFALGGYLLMRRTGLGRWAAVFGFTVLLFSSLTTLNFRQADDYVSVYRYVPLLVWAAVRYFQTPARRSGVLLGLVAGLAVTGYQTPNIALVALFALLAAAPWLRRTSRDTWAKLLPGVAVAVLIAMPFIVAAVFWVSNVASARELFPLGYRGGLGDILGPPAASYPDETVIAVGLIPLALALWRAAGIVAGTLRGREPLYGTSHAMLAFGLLTWTFYIGFPENFSGVDQPFLQIRSFNNMLPYVLFVLAYLAAEGLEITARMLRDRTPAAPRPWPFVLLLVAVLGITVFSELSRPGILSITINRYTTYPAPNGLEFVGRAFGHLSASHLAVSILFAGLVAALALAVLRQRVSAAFILVVLLAAGDLTLMNRKLLTETGSYTYRNTPERERAEPRPFVDTPLPDAPPRYREPELFMSRATLWHKQANVLYHVFTARSSVQYTWFRTKEFDLFVKSLPKEKLDLLGGVSSPTFRFLYRVVPADPGQALALLRRLPLEELRQSLVVEAGDIPADYPRSLPPGQGDLEIISYGPNGLTVSIRLTSPAYLCYADSHAPGWSARLDGAPTPLLRANYLSKALYVPAGQHVVEFRYRPWGYLASLAARGAGLLAALAVLAWPVLRRRKPAA